MLLQECLYSHLAVSLLPPGSILTLIWQYPSNPTWLYLGSHLAASRLSAAAHRVDTHLAVLCAAIHSGQERHKLRTLHYQVRHDEDRVVDETEDEARLGWGGAGHEQEDGADHSQQQHPELVRPQHEPRVGQAERNQRGGVPVQQLLEPDGEEGDGWSEGRDAGESRGCELTGTEVCVDCKGIMISFVSVN